MDEALPRLSGTTAAITARSAVDLVRLIATGEVSSREVVDAHIRRIEMVNPALNAVVVRLFDDAMMSATVADQALGRGRPLGPLHGLPITIKEMFDVAGTPTTAGLTKLAETRAREDAPLVQQLRRAGAMFSARLMFRNWECFMKVTIPCTVGRTILGTLTVPREVPAVARLQSLLRVALL